jgi:hypothetical protein
VTRAGTILNSTSYLEIEERELEAGGLSSTPALVCLQLAAVESGQAFGPRAASTPLDGGCH